VLVGTFTSTSMNHAKAFTALAATGMIFGAVYMLWMYQRVFLGKLNNEKNQNLPDMNLREAIVLLPIVIFIFWLGVRPGLVLDRLEPSIERLLNPLTEQLNPGQSPDQIHHTLLINPETGAVLDNQTQTLTER